MINQLTVQVIVFKSTPYPVVSFPFFDGQAVE